MTPVDSNVIHCTKTFLTFFIWDNYTLHTPQVTLANITNFPSLYHTQSINVFVQNCQRGLILNHAASMSGKCLNVNLREFHRTVTQQRSTGVLWELFNFSPLGRFERLAGSPWGRRILESGQHTIVIGLSLSLSLESHNCHLSLRIKHCSMPVSANNDR